MNTIQLTGRLTRDPELQHTTEGTAVCRLRLAVDRMGRGGDVGYIDVATFGNPATACAQVLAKGWLVAVAGRLTYGEWDHDGQRRSAHTVTGHVEFLARPRHAADDVPASPAHPDDHIGF